MEAKIISVNTLHMGNIQAVRNGTYHVRAGKVYRAVKNVQGKSLTAGMVVLASYDAGFNCGVNMYEVMGLTNDDVKYGEGGVAFSSVKELLAAKGVVSLRDLEELQDHNPEYGQTSYLVCKDMNTGEWGAWFYLYKGRWSCGSGAEALSFVLMEEVI